MDADQFPSIPEDVLKALHERYPERCAQPGDDLDGLMFYGGKRDLIRWLQAVFESQNESKSEGQA